MKGLVLIGAVISASLLWDLAHSGPEKDPRIRQELRGAEVPIHIVFGMQVADLRDSHQKMPDIAWQIVKQEMHLESEAAARAFLARMVVAADELDVAYDKLYWDMHCGQDSPRTRAKMTAALDTEDDLREDVDRRAYTKFMSQLSDQHAWQFDVWLKARRQGMLHIKFHHDRIYAPETDIVGRVDMNCADLRRSESWKN